MGVGGLEEKLGIFVKSITPGGAVYQNGQIKVCDQIVSVDGISLVGVSQLFAAQTLHSEVAQLIQQSLEQDHLKKISQQSLNDTSELNSKHSIAFDNKSAEIQPNNTSLSEEFLIKKRILELEHELSGSHKKAEQMSEVLENTRSHYCQLENKYDQARKLLKNYQDRERELLEREETHVEQIKEKDAHYNILVGQLKKRIDELENKLNSLAKQRTIMVEGELNDLKEKLAECSKKQLIKESVENSAIDNNEQDIAATTSNNKISFLNEMEKKKNANTHTGKCQYILDSNCPPPLPIHCTKEDAPRTQSRHAGLTQKEIPLSLSSAMPINSNYERFILSGGHIYATAAEEFGALVDERYNLFSSVKSTTNCESPVPRISEPTSPAIPQKFLNQNRRILFPLKKHFIHKENEFWRENVEAQGLQVLQWNTDEICQLLIHIGLDKYIPEFTVNQINGPKFLDLDGSKLKAIGILNPTDRTIIKKRIKTIKNRIEAERKNLEKKSRYRASMKLIN